MPDRAPGRQARRARARPAAKPAARAPGPAPEPLVLPVSPEAALWGVLIVITAALRLIALDTLPLTTHESARAFAAWAVSNGTVPEGWSGDATASLTAHLFRIFGSGETVARVVPALAGSALVASFWYMGRYLGRGPALLAAAFIALSPLAVFTSRSALGFALGGLLSVAMVVSLLTYAERPRPAAAVVLAAALGLALGSDPVAVTAAVALVAFVTVEAAWRSDGPVAEAFRTLRSDPDHWRPAAAALAVVLLLGVVQFGTDVDRLSLAGLREWIEMFDLPRDGLPWHFQITVLAAYEWPLLLAGGAAYLLLVDRWLFGGETPPPARRLLAIWTTVAIVAVAFATRRESGQLLMLLLPFSLLAAPLIERLISETDWTPLRRWWPAVGGALVLIGYGALQLSRWSRAGETLSAGEKTYAVLALLAAAGIVALAFYYFRRDGLAIASPIVAAIALHFLLHSSLSLAFGDGAEPAAGARSVATVRPFAASVAEAAAQTGLPVAIDPDLRDALGWHLRDRPIVFGDPADGAAYVAQADDDLLPGYEPLGGTWRVAERWFPNDFDLLPTWRWFVYRQEYGNLSSVDVHIMVPTQ